MKHFIFLFAVLFSTSSFAQVTAKDRVIRSNENGGKVIIAPRNSGGTVQTMLTADPAGGGVSLKGATDGSDACSGCVGQVLFFTTRTVTLNSATSWTANPSSLVILTPGTWLLLGRGEIQSFASGHQALTNIGTSTNGGQNLLLDGTSFVSNSEGTVSSPMNPGVISVSVSTPIYAHAYSYVSTGFTIDIGGKAIRIR